MDPREFNHSAERSLPLAADQRYRVELTFKLTDLRELWLAAAVRAMKSHGTRMEDVEGLLGPIEDPEITTCIAMLIYGDAPEGCVLEDFDVKQLPDLPVLDRIAA